MTCLLNYPDLTDKYLLSAETLYKLLKATHKHCLEEENLLGESLHMHTVRRDQTTPLIIKMYCIIFFNIS